MNITFEKLEKLTLIFIENLGYPPKYFFINLNTYNKFVKSDSYLGVLREYTGRYDEFDNGDSLNTLLDFKLLPPLKISNTIKDNELGMVYD